MLRHLWTVPKEIWNLILETKSRPISHWHKRHIMDTQVAETGRIRIETLGEEQYTKFVTERLLQCTTPVTQTLHTNKLPLFSGQPAKVVSKQQAQLAALKSNCGLFSRMYISCQTRDGDMDNFFSRESQAAPPVKADLLCCLKSNRLENSSAPVA